MCDQHSPDRDVRVDGTPFITYRSPCWVRQVEVAVRATVESVVDCNGELISYSSFIATLWGHTTSYTET